MKRRSLEVEEQLERGYEMKINFETDQIRRNLANRKEEKMAKLLDRQAAEKAEVKQFDFAAANCILKIYEHFAMFFL